MRRFLIPEWPQAILAIGLATILWVVVSGGQVSTAPKVLTAEVQVDLPADLAIVSGRIPATVEVAITGSLLQLGRVPRNLVATVDFSEANTGVAWTAPVVLTNLPKEVQATVTPATVSVLLERIVQREIPARLTPEHREQVIGDTRFTLQVTDIRATVTGLESLVRRVAAVKVEDDLAGIAENTVRPMALRAIDINGDEVPGIQVQPDHAPVHVGVHSLPPAKAVRVRPVFTGAPPVGYTYTAIVTPALIKVRGSEIYHEQWVEITTDPIALVGQTQTFTVQAALTPLPGAESMESDTAMVTVTIQETRIDRNVEAVPVQVWHLGANLAADLSPKTVTVQIRGFRRAVEPLTAAAIGLHVDATGLGPGQYDLAVAAQKPEAVEVVGLQPGMIQVIIREKPVPEPPVVPPSGPSEREGLLRKGE